MLLSLPALALFACSPVAAPPPQTTTLVAATDVPAPPAPHGHGGVILLPVYSSIYVGEGSQAFDLTVTVSVRNTDRAAPIVVTGLRYHDGGGQLLHDYAGAPTTIGPLASAETVVRASDRRAGVGGSFLVEWSAAVDVAEPRVQAVMVGSGYQQGISFVTEGRPLAGAPAAPPG